ncbi:PhzF family phenazine biosynthesis protein [Candidatus Poribacteria bacterium]|nr:PhzF family phenazine biosynthesis protein [Candidatus Poribacteria bacterium]
MTIQPFHQVDAFTNKPFSGNPAAVCVLEAERPAAWMQNVAMEMNLAETAFPRRLEDGRYELRWFTPACEVDLCGHATLASAHILWETGAVARSERIRFHSPRSGRLEARLEEDWIVLDFPSLPAEPSGEGRAVLEALGAEGIAAGVGGKNWLVRFGSEREVRALTPDFRALGRMGHLGVIATARAESGKSYDFMSRFFAPSAGIDEDPVTGSAHCTLTPYWARELGKDRMTAFQASRRGGTVRVHMNVDRVEIAGQAVTTMRGELLV